jgi:hypothetical protein
MSSGHIALIVVGLVGLAESSWGITAPAKLKTAVRAAVEDAPPRNLGLGCLFGGLAALLWILMSPDHRVSDYALLLLSWVFAGGSLVNFLPGGFHRLVNLLILERPAGFIRAFYAGEFVVAVFLILVAVFGQ